MFEVTLLENLDYISNYVDYCNQYDIEQINECPLCNYIISPEIICSIFDDKSASRYLILACPNCSELYVEKIEYSMEIRGTERIAIFPRKLKDQTFDFHIASMSPKFIEIYNQSNKAELYELNEIAGMGYRKSLEYLIKDYLKDIYPDKVKDIEQKQLGNCINEYIENPQIKIIAKGAAWLGNDETHYVRRWEDKDITDLKKLINITIQWIILDKMTKEYKEEMSL